MEQKADVWREMEEELKKTRVTQGKVEVKQDALWARLAQGTWLLEWALTGQGLLKVLQQDVMVARMAALSECFLSLFLSMLMLLGWAQEHCLLMDGAAAVLASLQERQKPEWTTPGTEQSLDLLGRLVAAHQWRNVPAPDNWFEQVLDEGKSLLLWDQLAEKALQKHSPEGVGEEFWGWPRGEGSKGGSGPWR